MTTPATRFTNDDDAARHWLLLLRDGDDGEKISAREHLAHIFERRGMINEAVEALTNNLAATGHDPSRYVALLALLWRNDRESEARVLTADLQALFRPFERERVYVQFFWAASFVLATTWGQSRVYRAGTASARWALLGCMATTLFLGWWGFPWGPIRTIEALLKNAGGGEDVTDLILNASYGTRDPGRIWTCPRCKRPMPNLVHRCLACGFRLK